MADIILPYQTSFVKGRNITDNIIIAQEVIYSMRKKSGRIGWMAIKVDLEKAFDRLRWDFIEETLWDVGLPNVMVDLIIKCISTPSMQILWNGKPSSPFFPKRGIRQGDLLSPLLFVLCMEHLSQAILAEVNKEIGNPSNWGSNESLSRTFSSQMIWCYLGKSLLLKWKL